MFWNKRRLVYDILVPPIEMPVEQLTPFEAEKYFHWYISKIPERVRYLSAFSKIQLDYSVKSLTAIWRWFLSHAALENTPSGRIEDLKEQLVHTEKSISNAIIAENMLQFSLQTEYILRDIAMYFGEVCVRNNLNIYWGFHTNQKKDSFSNRPILMGFLDRDFTPPFEAAFDPEFIVRNLAYNLFDGDAIAEDLQNMYLKWERMM